MYSKKLEDQENKLSGIKLKNSDVLRSRIMCEHFYELYTLISYSVSKGLNKMHTEG